MNQGDINSYPVYQGGQVDYAKWFIEERTGFGNNDAVCCSECFSKSVVIRFFNTFVFVFKILIYPNYDFLINDRV